MVDVADMRALYRTLGLKIATTRAGDGQRCRAGMTAHVRYTGRLVEDGPPFDTNADGEPLLVRAGRGLVVSGWDLALSVMCVGERASVTIPAALGYGTKGMAGRIPPNATLHFELELLAVTSTPDERLRDAAHQDDAVALHEALRDGADVRSADRKGATALHAAAGAGAAECLELLLERRAHPDAVCTQPAGVTPLMLAVSKGAPPLCIEMLLVAGADPAATSAKGNSAAKLAAKDAALTALLMGTRRNAPVAELRAGEHAVVDVCSTDAHRLRARAVLRRAVAAANPRVWLRFSIESGELDTRVWETAAAAVIEIELWAHRTPKTAENFRCLCTGERGRSNAFGAPPLHFKGSVVHRIVPGQVFQGGDFTRGDGRGGESIYGPKFADEDLSGRHDKKGLLSMANAGRNSNGSQFFITLAPLPHLDGKHTVFGRVTAGMELVELISGAAGEPSGGPPTMTVTIADCGEMPR